MFTSVLVNGVQIKSLVTGEPLMFYSTRVADACLKRITGEHRKFYKEQWGE